jgi:hypothetical protein
MDPTNPEMMILGASCVSMAMLVASVTMIVLVSPGNDVDCPTFLCTNSGGSTASVPCSPGGLNPNASTHWSVYASLVHGHRQEFSVLIFC